MESSKWKFRLVVVSVPSHPVQILALPIFKLCELSPPPDGKSQNLLPQVSPKKKCVGQTDGTAEKNFAWHMASPVLIFSTQHCIKFPEACQE